MAVSAGKAHAWTCPRDFEDLCLNCGLAADDRKLANMVLSRVIFACHARTQIEHFVPSYSPGPGKPSFAYLEEDEVFPWLLRDVGEGEGGKNRREGCCYGR